MNTIPISQLSSTSTLRKDDLILLSRMQYSTKYGVSYNITIDDLSNALMGDFQFDVSCGLKDLSDFAFELSNELSNTRLSVEENRLCIEYNSMRIEDLSSNLSSLSSYTFVKREYGKKVGSTTLPVYVKQDGYVDTISSYEGNSYTATKASCDYIGNEISYTYLNRKTGGTISGDLKLVVDGEEKSISTLLKEAGSVKTVNDQEPGEDGNVVVYANHINLSSDGEYRKYNVCDTLIYIQQKLDSEVRRLSQIV